MVSKASRITLISVLLTRFLYFSFQAATQLSQRSWVDPVPDTILPEKILGYSRISNPGPLGWQSDVLTTIPNKWSLRIIISVNINNHAVTCNSRNGIKIPNYKFKWILANSSISDRWTKFDTVILKRHFNPCNTEKSLIEENL